MKTKTLLIAAAALAAGVISSQAQVYSVNVVGYVNVPSPVGFAAIANPVSNGSNSATNFLDTTSGSQDGNIVLQWTGTTYSQVQIDSASATGFSDPNTAAVLPAPILAPGVGFLINNQNASNTLTFVGEAALVTTNVLSSSPFISLKGSIVPVGGGITSSLQLTNNAGALDGCLILIPNIVGGAIQGYAQTQFDSSSSTGFSDPNTSAELPQPQISVGKSFLFNNQSGSPIDWAQLINQ